jgi:hypothetical protein
MGFGCLTYISSELTNFCQISLQLCYACLHCSFSKLTIFAFTKNTTHSHPAAPASLTLLYTVPHCTLCQSSMRNSLLTPLAAAVMALAVFIASTKQSVYRAFCGRKCSQRGQGSAAPWSAIVFKDIQLLKTWHCCADMNFTFDASPML